MSNRAQSWRLNENEEAVVPQERPRNPIFRIGDSGTMSWGTGELRLSTEIQTAPIRTNIRLADEQLESLRESLLEAIRSEPGTIQPVAPSYVMPSVEQNDVDIRDSVEEARRAFVAEFGENPTFLSLSPSGYRQLALSSAFLGGDAYTEIYHGMTIVVNPLQPIKLLCLGRAREVALRT